MAGRRIDRQSGTTRLSLAWLGFALLVVPLPAQAQVTANLRLEQINGGCFVDDQEGLFMGDPDRYFRLGIFDTTAAPLLAACATTCTGDATPTTLDGSVLDYCGISTGCGVYDPADQTLSKIIPSQAGAYFYVGLWDDDDLPDFDDSLGDHWLFASSRSTSVAPANNNASPYQANNPIVSVCGRSVEGVGDPGNFNPRYSIWFTDQTPPAAASNVRLEDDGVVTTWDNDTTMTFFWTVASDPHSGVSHLVDLYSNEDGFLCSFAPAPAGSATFCSSGCTCPVTPVHGRSYFFRAGGRNGVLPAIDNPMTTMSSYIQVGVDLVNPVTAITAPPAGAWQNAAFGTSFSDTDSGAGVATASCLWGATSSGIVTRSGAARTCASGVTVSVGPGADCRHEGANICIVNGRSSDLARRASAVAQRTFSIDWTADTVENLQALTDAGGTMIAPAVWQSDNDPYFAWTASTSTSPIAGYSFALDASPDCVPDTTTPSYAFPSDAIGDGMHLFRVRPIDAAGNCGADAQFEIWVYQSQGMGPGSISGTLDVHLDPIDSSRLELVWAPSCGVEATDYAVYEGTLGAWYSHAPAECTTAGATTIDILPGAGNRYYLIVPLSLTEEGSYGTASGGVERPAGGASCLPQAPPIPCP